MFHYESCSLPDVWLKNGYEELGTPYGPTVAIHDIEGLHRAIGLALVTRKPALSGDEVRFLRKELDLSQAQLDREAHRNERLELEETQDGWKPAA